ncbi:unnamed protein product [Urochloa humidicola]
MEDSDCPPWKRTKKGASKPGRKKKAKKDTNIPEEQVDTPRKRAARAREAAIAAQAAAREAAIAAEVAAREADIAAEAVTSKTKRLNIFQHFFLIILTSVNIFVLIHVYLPRKLALGAPPHLEAQVPEPLEVEGAPSGTTISQAPKKKMTPRKKQLASKVKKATPKKI